MTFDVYRDNSHIGYGCRSGWTSWLKQKQKRRSPQKVDFQRERISHYKIFIPFVEIYKPNHHGWNVLYDKWRPIPLTCITSLIFTHFGEMSKWLRPGTRKPFSNDDKTFVSEGGWCTSGWRRERQWPSGLEVEQGRGSWRRSSPTSGGVSRQ